MFQSASQSSVSISERTRFLATPFSWSTSPKTDELGGVWNSCLQTAYLISTCLYGKRTSNRREGAVGLGLGCIWWSNRLFIAATASLLSFVFSDREGYCNLGLNSRIQGPCQRSDHMGIAEINFDAILFSCMTYRALPTKFNCVIFSWDEADPTEWVLSTPHLKHEKWVEESWTTDAKSWRPVNLPGHHTPYHFHGACITPNLWYGHIHRLIHSSSDQNLTIGEDFSFHQYISCMYLCTI